MLSRRMQGELRSLWEASAILLGQDSLATQLRLRRSIESLLPLIDGEIRRRREELARLEQMKGTVGSLMAQITGDIHEM